MVKAGKGTGSTAGAASAIGREDKPPIAGCALALTRNTPRATMLRSYKGKRAAESLEARKDGGKQTCQGFLIA